MQRWLVAALLRGLVLGAVGLCLSGTAFGGESTTNPGSGQQKVGWSQLETDAYPAYLDRLRAAGCPEDKVRWIIRSDADEWLLQQRVALAVKDDFAWWKDAPSLSGGEAFTEAYRKLRQKRDDLVGRLTGAKEPAAASSDPNAETPMVVNLSGPVLGALPREKYNRVQEICAGALDRQQGYFTVRQSEGVFLNQGDLANMRESTRQALAEVLSPEELEEFLLRYSHNANRLRTVLAGLEPTPEEFRAIFRVTDALEHRIQLEFGALDSLSARQREDFERRREEAIKGVLAPERYQRYLIGRYPLFRQAQLAVRRAGLPDSVVIAFYEVLNDNESRKREVLNNSTLAAPQRQAALRNIETEKEEALRRALGDDAYRQYRDSLVN